MQPRSARRHWARIAGALAAAGLGLAPAAAAPILPPLGSGLPPIDLPSVGDTARGTLGSLDPARLVDQRLERLRDLVRSHPRDLEFDDQGAAIVRGEVLAINPSP